MICFLLMMIILLVSDVVKLKFCLMMIIDRFVVFSFCSLLWISLMMIGVRFLVGLLRISSFGFISSFCVMVSICCLLFESCVLLLFMCFFSCGNRFNICFIVYLGFDLLNCLVVILRFLCILSDGKILCVFGI